MINPKLTLISSIAMLFATACGPSIKPSEFKAFIEDEKNGFSKTIEVEKLNIKCIYTPPAYLTVLSFRSDGITRAEYEQAETKFGAFDMYKLEVSAPDARHLSGMSEYFSFYMQDHISKICGTDTLPCVVYHAEPYSGIEGKQRIEIGFENSTCAKEEIVLHGTPFSPSAIVFGFDKKTLTIPQISLK
jgi:hypothetical protein